VGSGNWERASRLDVLQRTSTSRPCADALPSEAESCPASSPLWGDARDSRIKSPKDSRRQDDQHWPSSSDHAPQSFAYHGRLKHPLRLRWTASSNITAPAKSP